MIHKINNSVDYNKWLKRLETKLIEPTNENLIKVPNVFKLRNKKNVIISLYKCKKQPNIPSFPGLTLFLIFKVFKGTEASLGKYIFKNQKIAVITNHKKNYLRKDIGGG